MGRKILHSDFNSFYASVECQRRPEIRDKPVAVCGSKEARHGIVLTANYIAKKRGVKTGMAIWQAEQACPNLVIVPPDMKEYIRISRLGRLIYQDFTNQIEPFGLDECWLDVTGSEGIFGSAEEIAEEIRSRVKFELGITVSIGIGNNKIMAKLGSDYKKPDAITRMMPEDYESKVFPLPAKDLLYVGPATEEKLWRVGIYTIGDLAHASPDFLKWRLGKMGLVLHSFANGLDSSPVQRLDHVAGIKSVGNSLTAPRDLVCDDDIKIMLLLLAESVCSRLRDMSLKCTVVEISVRDSKLNSFTRQRKLKTATCSSQELAGEGFALFKQNYYWKEPIRSVGIRGSNLEPASGNYQLSFYPEDSKRDKWERIDATVDRIRDRYNYMAVQKALILSDPQLAGINPKDGHTVHPVSYFRG